MKTRRRQAPIVDLLAYRAKLDQAKQAAAPPAPEMAAVDELLNLGVDFHGRGELVVAEHCYRGVLAARPTHVEACFNLAVVLHDRECWDASLVAYKAVLKLDKAHADAHFNISQLYGRMSGADAMKRAVRHLNTYRKLTKGKAP